MGGGKDPRLRFVYVQKGEREFLGERNGVNLGMTQSLKVQNLIFNLAAQAQNLSASLNREEKPKFVVLELSGSYPARAIRKFPDVLFNRQESLEEFEYKLEVLSKQSWLEGVILRLDALNLDWGKAYSMRRAIERLSEKKKTYVLAQGFNMRSYFAVSSASHLVLPEGAELELLGLSISQPYFKDLMGRYGVSFDAVAIKEYKSAVSSFTQSESTPEQREQLERLIASLQETFCSEVARSRGVSPETVAGWLRSGLSSAAEAKRLGVIDRVAYEDELLSEMHQPMSSAAKHLTVPMREGAGRVAVVKLEGTIVTGRSKRSPLPMFDTGQVGSESVIRALRLAEEDEATQSIVLYVDSGGGSALASDLIWREVKRIAALKPIVAVMGSAAASGGYYVLTHARHVIAAPTTLTGSIGVVLGKAVLEGFNAKYGINNETFKTAPLADYADASHPFDPAQRTWLERSAAEVYDRFVSRVAEGRGIPPARVNEIGRGRVWTGADALGLGLVDALGTLEDGIQKAKELAGLPHGASSWTVEAGKQMVIPEGGEGALELLMPLLKERVLLTMPLGFKLS